MGILSPNVWVSHLLDKDSTPCHVFPSVMNSIHSNVRDIVASPFWKEVGEGDPFAMALHLCVFANKYFFKGDPFAMALHLCFCKYIFVF